MSAILQTVPKTATGRILFDAAGAIDHYHNGLPFTAAGALCTNNAPPDYYHQGLPFSAAGRLCTGGGAPTRFSTGSAGFGNGEQNSASGDGGGAITHYTHGVPFTATGTWAGGV
jgi:hypothetical protein